jgi:hypothetical protein
MTSHLTKCIHYVYTTYCWYRLFLNLFKSFPLKNNFYIVFIKFCFCRIYCTCVSWGAGPCDSPFICLACFYFHVCILFFTIPFSAGNYSIKRISDIFMLDASGLETHPPPSRPAWQSYFTTTSDPFHWHSPWHWMYIHTASVVLLLSFLSITWN